MKKEWDDFQKEFKKFQAKTKGMKFDNGYKVHQQLIDALETAWDFEDDLKDAVKDAIEQGNKGTKPDDFNGSNDFNKARAGWVKQLAAHKQHLKSLSSLCDNARKRHDELKKMTDPVIKDVKKSKDSKDAKKEIQKVLDEAESELGRLDEIATIYGKLKIAEIFYAAKQDQTLQIIVKKVAKKAAGKDLPKILEEAEGKKNLKEAEKTQKDLIKTCEQVKEAGDKKEAQKLYKDAAKELGGLKKLSSGYEAAAKKMAKEIAAAPNKKEIEKLISTIGGIFKDCEALVKKAAVEAKKAA